MNDRQLLKAAAKAAGINVGYVRSFGYMRINADGSHAGLWNPLKFGDQAFELCVLMDDKFRQEKDPLAAACRAVVEMVVKEKINDCD